MARPPGPRPHLWKHPGDRAHAQGIAFLRMRCQARYRKEPWDLSFEDFQTLWDGHWTARGRGSTDYCLTRKDRTQPWSLANCQCITRNEYLVAPRKRSA